MTIVQIARVLGMGTKKVQAKLWHMGLPFKKADSKKITRGSAV